MNDQERFATELNHFFGPDAFRHFILQEVLTEAPRRRDGDGGASFHRRNKSTTLLLVAQLDEIYGTIRTWWEANPSVVEIVDADTFTPITSIDQVELLPTLQVPVAGKVISLRIDPALRPADIPSGLFHKVYYRLIHLTLEQHLGLDRDTTESLELLNQIRDIGGMENILGVLRGNYEIIHRFAQINLTGRRISGIMGHRVRLTTRKADFPEDLAYPTACTTTIKGNAMTSTIRVSGITHGIEKFIDIVPFTASVEEAMRETIREFTGSDDDFGFSMTPLNA